LNRVLLEIGYRLTIGTQMTQKNMIRYDFTRKKSYLIIFFCVICVPIVVITFYLSKMSNVRNREKGDWRQILQILTGVVPRARDSQNIIKTIIPRARDSRNIITTVIPRVRDSRNIITTVIPRVRD